MGTIGGVRIIDKDGNDVDLQPYLQITDKDGNIVPVPGSGEQGISLSVRDENTLLLEELLVAIRISNKHLSIITGEDLTEDDLEDQ